MSSVKGKTVVIVGSGKGIGALAKGLEAAGAVVLIGVYGEGRENDASSRMKIDPNSYASIVSVFQRAYQIRGNIDIVIAYSALDTEDDTTIQDNLTLAMYTTKMGCFYFREDLRPSSQKNLHLIYVSRRREWDAPGYDTNLRPLQASAAAGLLGFQRSMALAGYAEGYVVSTVVIPEAGSKSIDETITKNVILACQPTKFKTAKDNGKVYMPEEVDGLAKVTNGHDHSLSDPLQDFTFGKRVVGMIYFGTKVREITQIRLKLAKRFGMPQRDFDTLVIRGAVVLAGGLWYADWCPTPLALAAGIALGSGRVF